MQSENSSSLKAGSTKNKQAHKGVTSQMRYPSLSSSKKGFSRLKAPMSGTKTSQSEMEGTVVVVDGKVKTPKQYLPTHADSSPRPTKSTLKNI